MAKRTCDKDIITLCIESKRMLLVQFIFTSLIVWFVSFLCREVERKSVKIYFLMASANEIQLHMLVTYSR